MAVCSGTFGTCTEATRRRRSDVVVIAALVLVLSLYFCLGHATHVPMAGMDSAAHGVGICLLAAALLAPLVLVRPAGLPVLAPASLLIPSAPLLPSAVPFRARASPAWLQRFLN